MPKDKGQKMAYQREYQKGWYRRHKEKLLQMRKQRRAEIQEWFRAYKSKICCVDCGESHPACLQFHHKNREEKSFTVSIIAGRSTYSIKTILKEIEKCEVLCGNCHAKRHWREAHETDSWLEIVPLGE